MTTESEPELTDTQKAYNVAQYEMFQLAAYGHCTYTPRAELLTDEGKAEQADYNDRIRKAREELESAMLRLVAEHAETFRGDWGVPANWLRSLANDPSALSLLAVPADELEPAAAPAAVPPTDRAGLRELIADVTVPLLLDALPKVIARARGYEVADAVLALLFGPIPAGTDTATWTAIRAIQLMNEAGRERDASTGASALTDKLLRVRDLHRETCIAAKGDVSPTAFCCGMCQVLDAPAAAVLPAPVDRAAVFAGVRPQTLTAIASHLDARAVAILRPDSETYGEWQAVVAELRQLAAGTPQPETQAAAVLLSSPCDACRHTLNWHRNDIGCVVARCVCSRFQPPADDAPAVTLPGKEA